MYDTVEGINEEELSSLTIEILDYADRISEIFDKLDDTIEKLPSCYQGKPCKEILSKYKDLSSNYSTIKDNITSYSDDLLALIRKMRDNEKSLTTLFQGYSDELDSKTKLIN